MTTPTTSPAPFKSPKSTAFGAALSFVQALIGLVFHLAGGDPKESVVMLLAGILLASGWTLGEAWAKRAAKGRMGLILAIAGNLIGASIATGAGSGCASFPAERGGAGHIRIDPDPLRSPPACVVTFEVDGVDRDTAALDDCTNLLPKATTP